jgi:hypothetical protein
MRSLRLSDRLGFGHLSRNQRRTSALLQSLIDTFSISIGSLSACILASRSCTGAPHIGTLVHVSAIRAAQTGVYIFFDVSGFKASFGVKWLRDIDRRPVRNSDIQVKNARLSGPIRCCGYVFSKQQRSGDDTHIAEAQFPFIANSHHMGACGICGV